MASIFVSYRRLDSPGDTGRIYDRLSSHFGKEAVFKDVDSIPLAVDFRQEIDSQIKAAKIVLVIIGPTWLKILKSRINDPNDWVRIEIETALLYRVPILPVTVNGADLPSPDELPISIRFLVNQNAAKARPDPDFHTDVDRLVKGLEDRFGLTRTEPIEQQTQSSKTSKVPQIWLHGWSQYRANNETSDLELNWGDRYDKPSSTYPSLDEWKITLAPQLKELKQSFDDSFSSQTIEFRSTLPLAPMLAVGHSFPRVGHYKLKIKQSEDIWQSYGIAPSQLRFAVKEARGKPGPNLMIGFGVTDNAWPAMEKLLQKPIMPLDAAVYLQIPQTGSMSIDNADAIALAVQAKDLIRHYKQEYDAQYIHLIVLAPAAYALFLGHHLNRLGEIIIYEFISNRYQPVARINT